MELARAAVDLAQNKGLPVVGFDLAGAEAGYPADDHAAAYQYAHDHFSLAGFEAAYRELLLGSASPPRTSTRMPE